MLFLVAGCGGGGGEKRSSACVKNPALQGCDYCVSNQYKSCYGGDVYWYDSCDTRGSVYETCGSNAECESATCVYEWGKTYDDLSRALSIVQTPDGGYALTGTADEVAIVKISANGDKQWSKTYGSGFGETIIVTSDGGLAVAGVKTNGMALVKTNNAGEIEWSKSYELSEGVVGMYQGKKLLQTKDGGYAILGMDRSYKAFILKADASGNKTWLYGSENAFLGASFALADDGGFVLCARSDIYLSLGYFEKVDNSGGFEWSYNQATPPDWRYCYINKTDTGDFVSFSETGVYVMDNYGQVTGAIKGFVRIDSDGTVNSTSSLESMTEYINNFIITSDDGYLFVGKNDSEGWLMKTDSSVVSDWEISFSSSGDTTELYDVTDTTDNGYIAVGYLNIGSNYDAAVIKVNSKGECSSCFD